MPLVADMPASVEADPSGALPMRAVVTAAMPPRVSCNGNQLTILAENSTLSSILSAVQACIGVQMRLPEGSPDERSYLQLGPGLAREVLDQLLSSTELNYIIQPLPTAPQKISSVLLMTRGKDTTDGRDRSNSALVANIAMTPSRRAWLISRQSGRPAAPTTNDEPSQPIDSAAGSQQAPERTEMTEPETAAGAGAISDIESKDGPKGNETITKSSLPGEVPVAVEAPSVAATPEAEQPASPAKELQNRITQMQQLFEERKKQITSLGAPPEKD